MVNGWNWIRSLAGAAAICLSVGALPAQTLHVQGAGATFPAPLYSKWISTYNQAHPDVKVDYQAIGSGGGIKGITDRTLQFAGSDAPMTDDQEAKTPAKVLHLPVAGGPEVMIYNLPDYKGELKLDGPTVAGIYLGQITKWNDPKIAALNAGQSLPDQDIVVVHRSDGSGTTYIFVDYLSRVSPEWKTKVGKATAVKWPVGLGGKGNDGVAANVKNTSGSIGYVELAYAKNSKLTYATQINADGKAVQASIDGVVAAAAVLASELPENLKVSITNATGETSYPICGFTYLLVYQDLSYLKDKALAQAVADYLAWAVTDGQELAGSAGYARLPAPMQVKVKEKLKTLVFNGEALVK